MDENDEDGAKKTHNLTRKEYSEKIGVQRLRRWIKKKKKKNTI